MGNKQSVPECDKQSTILRPLAQNLNREFDQELLERAFTCMGDYLVTEDCGDVTAVCIGGIVNVLLLQHHTVTSDIAALGTIGSYKDGLLTQAKCHARKQMKDELSVVWLDPVIRIRAPKMRDLIKERAVKQGAIVFQHTGLILLAAPWDFAFCDRLDRWITGWNTGPNDLEDAALYLNQWICAHGNKPVPKNTVLQWARNWNITLGSNHHWVKDVNEMYHSLFATVGIGLEDLDNYAQNEVNPSIVADASSVCESSTDRRAFFQDKPNFFHRIGNRFAWSCFKSKVVSLQEKDDHCQDDEILAKQDRISRRSDSGVFSTLSTKSSSKIDFSHPGK